MTRVPVVLGLVAVALFAAANPAIAQKRRSSAVIAPTDPKVADAKALEAAGLKPDDPGPLLAYFRQRTLSDTDVGRILAVIRRFAEDDFDERLKAQAEAERFGPAAVGPLRTAQADPNPEIAYRAAESLKRLEKVPHASVALAGTRALARLKPPEAAEVLIGFLPLADDDAVAEEIRKTLVLLAVRDGKADPALLAALSDPTPIRRAAAGIALIEGGPADRRVRVPDAFPKVRAAAAAEEDVDTKFQLVHALLTTARDKDAVGLLIDLLPDLPRGRLWQAEDYLVQLAGTSAPNVRFGRGRDSLVQAKDAWKGWWAAASANADLEKFRYQPRIAGRTLLVLTDLSFGSRGTVLELGPDMKERWKITNLGTTMDAQFLPNGTVLIAEQGGRLSLRDTAGRHIPDPTVEAVNRAGLDIQSIQVLPNENLIAIGRNAIVEFKKGNGAEVIRYDRPLGDITAATRLPDGTTAVLVLTAPNYFVFLDDKGKEQPSRTLKAGMPHYQAGMEVSGRDRLLVTENNQVVEYDLKENKSVWSKAVPGQPRSVQRLPNGNTLIVLSSGNSSSGRVIEVTPEGEEVWSYTPSGKLAGLMPSRAIRR